MIDQNSLSPERKVRRTAVVRPPVRLYESKSVIFELYDGVIRIDRRPYDGNALSRSRSWTPNRQNYAAGWRTSNEQYRIAGCTKRRTAIPIGSDCRDSGSHGGARSFSSESSGVSGKACQRRLR